MRFNTLFRLFCATAALSLNVASAQADDTVAGSRLIRGVEAALSKEGYDVGKVDGTIDTKTRDAVKAYQRNWGLQVTGHLDDTLIAMLEGNHSLTISRWTRVANIVCHAWNMKPRPGESITWSGGCDYDDDSSLGKLDGQGTLISIWYLAGKTKMTSFRGIYRNGYKHSGELVDHRGNVYEGKWKHERFHGHGALATVDGNYYVGEWKRGKQDGYGKARLKSGNRYHGQWKAGVPHGEGSYFFKTEGRTYTGTWTKGCGRITAKKEPTKNRKEKKLKVWIGTTKKACGF